jgi:hypothetical protein
MRRSILLVLVVAISVSTGAWLWAQTPKTAPPTPVLTSSFGLDGSQPSRQPAAKPAEFASSPPLATATVEAINLRNRFIELSKMKAHMMKEAQLKHEIEALEREIPELEAWAKAEEVARLLHQVIDKHPNTQAAKSAQEAIQLIERRAVPGQLQRNDFAPQEEFRPAPDKPFDRGPSRHDVPAPLKPIPERDSFSS